jgi:K+-sensing histidine kinase KdpD
VRAGPIVRHAGFCIVTVAVTTAAIFALARIADPHHLIWLYLVPITAVMLRSGFVMGLLTALVSMGAVAFFFYDPAFSFYVADVEEAIELIIFSILAIVIAYLATVLRETSRMDAERRKERGSAVKRVPAAGSPAAPQRDKPEEDQQ